MNCVNTATRNNVIIDCLIEHFKLRNLEHYLSSNESLLGEGASAKVYAVDIPGYLKLCLKFLKWKASHVLGIPRFIAVCNCPPSILMTQVIDSLGYVGK